MAYIYFDLPSAVFIEQRLVGPGKQLKQIIQIEHNIVKNPNWSKANQLAIYRSGRGFELGATVKQIRVMVRAGLFRTCDRWIASPTRWPLAYGD